MTAGPATHFAARRFWNRTWHDQEQLAKAQVVYSCDRFPGDGVQLRCIQVLRRFALDLVHHAQLFLPVSFHGKRCAAGRSQRQVTLLNSPLDILRVVVPTADDDDVLYSAREKQIAGVRESEIASSQVLRTVVRDKTRAKRSRILRFSAPIALGYAGTAYPDFPDLPDRASTPRVRANDRHPMVSSDGSAADDLDAGIVRCNSYDPVTFQTLLAQPQNSGLSNFPLAADEERRLRRWCRSTPDTSRWADR